MGGDFILRLANETLSNFNPLRPCGRRPESALKGSERAYFNPLRPCGRRLLGFKSQQLPAPFQSTPPVWAETEYSAKFNAFIDISIHSARVGGDFLVEDFLKQSNDFNPLRPCGRRQTDCIAYIKTIIFQSTPPVWAETKLANLCGNLFNNFNPLRPCGRRRLAYCLMLFNFLFQSTPPVWAETITNHIKTIRLADFNPLRPCGRRQSLFIKSTTIQIFQSTPPVWAETHPRILRCICVLDFNPLRPCGRRLQRVKLQMQFVDISIHSARVGGDKGREVAEKSSAKFQSTPPVWAETAKETIFSSLKHLYYNIFYRKKQENSM